MERERIFVVAATMRGSERKRAREKVREREREEPSRTGSLRALDESSFVEATVALSLQLKMRTSHLKTSTMAFRRQCHFVDYVVIVRVQMYFTEKAQFNQIYIFIKNIFSSKISIHQKILNIIKNVF
jgi:hypothetical protein